MRIYNPSEIIEWIEEKSGAKTALGPYCDLVSTIIFTIVFVKHQQKAHKNVSK